MSRNILSAPWKTILFRRRTLHFPKSAAGKGIRSRHREGSLGCCSTERSWSACRLEMTVFAGIEPVSLVKTKCKDSSKKLSPEKN